MASVMLTFDDGPDPAGTPAVLDALSRAGAQATFFLVAPLATRHPELVAQIVAAGHRIGVHCDEHVRHSERDASWGRRDLRRALKRLSALGVHPSLWRTPWGDIADWTAGVARGAGLRIVGWSVDTHDWRGDRAEAMLAATDRDLCDGAIVLAHDGIGPGARRADVTETVRYVELVAQQATRCGFTLAGLS